MGGPHLFSNICAQHYRVRRTDCKHGDIGYRSGSDAKPALRERSEAITRVPAGAPRSAAGRARVDLVYVDGSQRAGDVSSIRCSRAVAEGRWHLIWTTTSGAAVSGRPQGAIDPR